MRLIDADNLRGRVCEIFLCAEPSSAEERRFAIMLGLIDSELTIAPPPNDPLTLDELREMEGEPVWVVQVNGKLKPFWMLIDAEDESAASSLYCAMFEDYGTEWLAYRRKPEEGAA